MGHDVDMDCGLCSLHVVRIDGGALVAITIAALLLVAYGFYEE